MVAPEWALQSAVMTALESAPALEPLLGTPVRIYDRVPRNPGFPFASLGETVSEPADTASEWATAHRLSLHVWSRYAGRKEIKDIAGAIRDVLHDGDLTLEGHALVLMRFLSSQTIREPDGLTRQAVLRFRAVVEGV